MDEIEELTGDVLTSLGSAEGAELLIAGNRGSMRDIYIEKLSYELGRLVDIHPTKIAQLVSDIYADEVVPAVGNLKAALKGRRIEWLGMGSYNRTAFSLVIIDSGSSGFGSAYSTPGWRWDYTCCSKSCMYNEDKRESLRAKLFAYLLSVERELP